MAGIGAAPPAGWEQLTAGALAAAGALRLRVRGVLSHAWSLSKVGFGVRACGVLLGLVEQVAAWSVSKFVENWTFSSTREKNPINGRIWPAKLVESCRMVTEVGFFGKCRKKNQKKRCF